MEAAFDEDPRASFMYQRRRAVSRIERVSRIDDLETLGAQPVLVREALDLAPRPDEHRLDHAGCLGFSSAFQRADAARVNHCRGDRSARAGAFDERCRFTMPGEREN